MSNPETNRSSLLRAAGVRTLHMSVWLTAALLLLCSVVAARAQYGTVSELDPVITNAFGTMGCVPTAVVNSFVYLDNNFSATLLPDAGSDQDVLNLGALMGTSAAGGTTAAGWVTGKWDWVQEYDPAVTMTGQDKYGIAYDGMDPTPPTWQFIENEFTNHEDVEIGIIWPNSIGHVLTLTGCNLDTNGNGTVTFIDPWGGVALSGTLMNNNGTLTLNYIGGGAGNPPGNTGTITMVTAESIPEPSSAILVCWAGLMICSVCRFRSRWLRN